MARKLTKEEINQSLKQFGKSISIIGEYTNIGTKTLFRCDRCSHEFMAWPNDIKNNNGDCPECGRYTKTSINKILSSRGIVMTGEYVNANHKTKFRCEHHHEWVTKPSYIINMGSGCPICSDNRISTEEINIGLKERDITLVEPYTNDKTLKYKFICSVGHTWNATVSSVRNAKSGCPFCSVHGYNPGIPGYAYVIDFGYFIKIGITNDSERRLNEHRKQGMKRVIECRYYDDGNIPKEWERKVLLHFNGKYVTREELPNGWTETLSSNLIIDVIEMLV